MPPGCVQQMILLFFNPCFIISCTEYGKIISYLAGTGICKYRYLCLPKISHNGFMPVGTSILPVIFAMFTCVDTINAKPLLPHPFIVACAHDLSLGSSQLYLR